MTKSLAATPAFSTTGLGLSHYRCISGYLDLSGNRRECGIMQDTRIVCVPPSARAKTLASLQKPVEGVETTRIAGKQTIQTIDLRFGECSVAI